MSMLGILWKSWDGFDEHPGVTLVANQSETKIISLKVMYLVTLKAGAEHELLFNKPASGGEKSLMEILTEIVGILTSLK